MIRSPWCHFGQTTISPATPPDNDNPLHSIGTSPPALGPWTNDAPPMPSRAPTVSERVPDASTSPDREGAGPSNSSVQATLDIRVIRHNLSLAKKMAAPPNGTAKKSQSRRTRSAGPPCHRLKHRLRSLPSACSLASGHTCQTPSRSSHAPGSAREASWYSQTSRSAGPRQ